jgi:hypothetical protein
MRTSVESATFQKWLAEHGCRFDTAQEKRGTGHANVTVHREGRKAELPLGSPHRILDARIVGREVRRIWISTGSSCPDRRVGFETREKVHNRRRSYIRARKLSRKMQRAGLLPMKPRWP